MDGDAAELTLLAPGEYISILSAGLFSNVFLLLAAFALAFSAASVAFSGLSDFVLPDLTYF